MTLTIRHRAKIYRRYGIDIWGLTLYLDYKANKATSFFLRIMTQRRKSGKKRGNPNLRRNFRLDNLIAARRRAFQNWDFVSLRILKLFYLTLTYAQFRNFARKAAKRDGLFESNYCGFVEGRLLPMVYRTNFLYNMFEIRDYIKAANVYINGVCVNYPNFVVKVGDFVTFNKYSLSWFKRCLYSRLRYKCVYFNTPRYMYVNYKLFFAFMECLPSLDDLAYPIKIEMMRAVSNYR